MMLNLFRPDCGWKWPITFSLTVLNLLKSEKTRSTFAFLILLRRIGKWLCLWNCSNDFQRPFPNNRKDIGIRSKRRLLTKSWIQSLAVKLFWTSLLFVFLWSQAWATFLNCFASRTFAKAPDSRICSFLRVRKPNPCCFKRLFPLIGRETCHCCFCSKKPNICVQKRKDFKKVALNQYIHMSLKALQNWQSNLGKPLLRPKRTDNGDVHFDRVVSSPHQNQTNVLQNLILEGRRGTKMWRACHAKRISMPSDFRSRIRWGPSLTWSSRSGNWKHGLFAGASFLNDLRALASWNWLAKGRFASAHRSKSGKAPGPFTRFCLQVQ